MSDIKSTESLSKKPRAQNSIEDEISKAEAKLKKLYEMKKEKERKERERNQKVVMELIKAERLDAVPAEKWRKLLPELKALLIGKIDTPSDETLASE